MSPDHLENLPLRVGAPGARVYTLEPQRRANRGEIHRLELVPREWPDRFKDGARDALRGALVTTLLAAGLVLPFLCQQSQGSWLGTEVTVLFITFFGAIGLTVGFTSSLFLRDRPSRRLVEFGQTVIFDGEDLGSVVEVNVGPSKREVTLVTERARKAIRVRTEKDAVVLRAALRKILMKRTEPPQQFGD